MGVSLGIPWNRCALIVELAKRLENVRPQFGKTALQKLMFLLQEIYHVHCGCHFFLYSYGPFSTTLVGDMDAVEHFGCVEVQRASSMAGGYVIKPGKKADSLHDKAAAFLKAEQTRAGLTSLVRTYGHRETKDLELPATTAYVARNLRRKSESVKKEDVCRIVGLVKPRFSAYEARGALDELESNGHIRWDT